MSGLFFPPKECPCGRVRSGGMLVGRPLHALRPILSVGYINVDGDCYWWEVSGVWRHEFTPRPAA